MKILLGLLLLIGSSCAVGAWYWTSQDDEAPEFRLLEVDRGELLIAISATGTVEPVEVIDVGAQIVGRIRSFGPDPNSRTKTIDYGSHVQQGDVLAQLDDSALAAELEKGRAMIKLNEAELQRAQAQLAQARQEFERAEKLRGTNSQREYDVALSNHEMAKAEVAIAEARLEQSKIAMQAVEIDMGYTTIKAPIDGVVIDRRVNVGQTVVAGLNAPSLFLLARDLDRMQVLAAVNEADIGEIQLGQKVTFKVDAHRNDTFHGTVSQVRLNAGLSHNVVTYDVVVDIDNTDGKLLPYMTASLQFEVVRRTDVLLVPNQALRWRPTRSQITPSERDRWPLAAAGEQGNEPGLVEVDSPTVWVLAEDGLVRSVPVETGLSDGIETEIVAGELEPKTPVVLSARRQAKRDFVSSFISRVTKPDEK